VDYGCGAARVAGVAWRGDRVMRSATSPTVRGLAGPSTRVIDLHGRSATPG